MNFNIFSSPKYLGIFFDSKLLPTYLPSDEDVSFILGIVPLFVMIFVPIYGFIGDIIGFRFVLTFDVVIMAVSITLFHQVPRFEKHLLTAAPVERKMNELGILPSQTFFDSCASSNE